MPPNVRRRSQPKKKKEDTTLPSSSAGARRPRRKAEPLRYLIAGALVLGAIYTILTRRGQISSTSASEDRVPVTKRDAGAEKPFQATQEEVEGHGDFGDGRRTTAKPAFLDPASEALHWVNVNLGNGGPEPNLSGGMIPAVAPPFGMTRWSPQTRQNYVSMCPYNQTETVLHGFIGTHQPAIWMGESGPAQISAGLGTVKTNFEDRGLPFDKADEYASANYYRNVLDAGSEGKIEAEMTATSRVGHLRYTFDATNVAKPYFVVQASRESVLLSADNTESRDPSNVTYPLGSITIDLDRKEVYGWNDERQDRILVGDDLPAKSFKGYFVARFSHTFDSTGVSTRDSDRPGATSGEGEVLAGYVTFPSGIRAVEARIGVSFISIEQARRNIDLEIPDGQSFIDTSRSSRQSWKDKLDTLSVTGATDHNKTVLYSSFAHTLVYPYEIHESTPNGPAYYSGYLDKVVSGESYSGYSIWDTYRAETAWLILNAPERVPGQINSMLQDYREGGWLPMWKNLVETNIMVGTHSDSIIAQAIKAGVQGVNWSAAWEAVKKNAYTPPDKDTKLQFGDREEHTPQEVRAGLTEYSKLGYVANDLHTESGSRTLDYAYDDWAASIVAEHVGASEEAAFLRARAASYKNIWNRETGFMEARSSNGSWAGENEGWTEGDHWAYSLSVMHDVPGLIQLMGGKAKFIEFLDRHFDGDHNLHTNEPSHHIPYLYSFAGAAAKSQERIRQIGQDDYNHTADGLSGNEDCGQMSAWYLFSAMGFYPVDPASATYIIGAPFFDKIVLDLPNARKPLTITAQGASQGKKYIKSMTIDGKPLSGIEISHDQIKDGADIVFEMADTPQSWGS